MTNKHYFARHIIIIIDLNIPLSLFLRWSPLCWRVSHAWKTGEARQLSLNRAEGYNPTLIVMYLNNSQPKSSLLNMHAFIYEHYLFYLLCICTKTNKQIAPQKANTTVVSTIVYVFCVNLKRQNKKSLLFFLQNKEETLPNKGASWNNFNRLFIAC